MLCATSPGECVGTPNSCQVCLVCSLDVYIRRWEPPLRHAALIKLQNFLISSEIVFNLPENDTSIHSFFTDIMWQS